MSGNHADSYIKNLRPKVDVGTDFDITHRDDLSRSDVRSRTTTASDIKLSHPVGDKEELENTTHLQVLIGDANRERFNLNTTWSDATNQGYAFDYLILLFADLALDAVALTPAEAGIKESRLKALLLMEARKLTSPQKLRDHLKDTPRTAQALEIHEEDDVPSRTTYWRAMNELEDCEGGVEALETAALEAVYAVERTGFEIPEAISKHYLLHEMSSEIDERTVRMKTRRQALRNTIIPILDIARDELSFNRSENSRYSMLQIIGLLAHSAIQGVGLRKGTKTASGWLYDPDLVIEGSGVLKHIKSLSFTEIDDQFTNLNARLLGYVARAGFFEEAPDFAYDTTAIAWTGEDNDWTVNHAKNNPDSTQEWMFSGLSIMDNDARFALGISLLRDNSEKASQLERLLEYITDEIEIGRVWTDRGFYGNPSIKALRAEERKRWVIRSPIRDDVKDFVMETPRGEAAFKENVVTFANPSANVFLYPKAKKDGQRTLTDFVDTDRTDGVGSSNTHYAYLTDLTPADISAETIREAAETIHDDYSGRWNVESFFRQWKHDFHPVSESGNPLLRHYLANIAMFFYNIHTFVNRTTSPMYALPLDETAASVLTAIRDVAIREFPDSGGA